MNLKIKEKKELITYLHIETQCRPINTNRADHQLTPHVESTPKSAAKNHRPTIRTNHANHFGPGGHTIAFFAI